MHTKESLSNALKFDKILKLLTQLENMVLLAEKNDSYKHTQ